MPMDLNIVTFIFFALSVVIFIQLRSVLGRRTGHERQPFDPYSKSEARSAEKAANTEAEAAVKARDISAVKDPFAEIDAYAPSGSALHTGLRAVRKADETFAARDFIAGARVAYERVLTAFAEGKETELRPLLAENIYEEFARALKARSEAGERVKFSFIGVEKADITEAHLEKDQARLTVAFKGEIISASYDRNGALIDGDEQNIVVLKDIWTFTRNIASRSPNWLLTATEDGA